MKDLAPFRVAKYANKFFLFDGGTGSVFEISEILKDIIELENCKKNYNTVNANLKNILLHKYDHSEVDNGYEIIRLNQENGMLVDNSIIEKLYTLKSNNIKIRNLCINITESCNLKCRYCFAKSRETAYMDSETLIKCIDKFLENLDVSSDYYTINFFGGEPLLNYNIIIVAIKYLKDKMKKDYDKLRFILTTNGTIINDEILKFLSENKFELSVSIDGLEFIHNHNRPYANTKVKSFYDTISNYKQLNNVCKEISAQITLRKCDIKYLKMSVEYLWQLGVNKVYSNLVFDKEEIYSYEDYKEYQEQVKNISDAMYNNLSVGVTNIYGNVFEQIKTIHLNRYNANCFMWSKTALLFSTDGQEYKCYRGFNDPKYNSNIIYEKKVSDKCKNCYIRLYCGDGCPYENEIYNSDIDKISEEFCMKSKVIFDESLNIYLKILNDNNELLKIYF